MRKLVIQPAARLDMLDIWDYIAADNIVAAQKVYRAFDTCDSGTPSNARHRSRAK